MDKHTTVIIADNSEEFCSALATAVQRTDGFQVLGTANDGEQAIRLVTERKPNILVLDMMLAKKDGVGRLAFSGTPQEAKQYFGVDIRDAYTLLDKHPERYIR